MLTPLRTALRTPAECDTVQTLAFAACDDELTRDDIVAIDAHLAVCLACRERIARDAAFLRAIRRAVSLETAPQSLRDRVAQSLQSHAPENASR
jgi:predicted anti-sigma-YlaC factor YlaD